ncbi:hypothetical protein [Nocardia nepalensis]|uniref:hypothetical protein n=1 Tax=Nocardia nepalensis TaxID=3375448 RepID=UPI003B66ECA0
MVNAALTEKVGGATEVDIAIHYPLALPTTARLIDRPARTRVFHAFDVPRKVA